MTDIPALWINGGILVLTGVTALVAFVQARHALADAGKAEEARDEAMSAQTASAAALDEANRIAAEARDLMKSQEARATERHDVRWVPMWQQETGKWFLANRGQDTAREVRLRTDATIIGIETQEDDEVPPGTGLSVQLPERFFGAGHVPIVVWRIEWKTALGTEHVREGRWPSP